ncbi:response regulator [Candidatus Woesearchaeota archaeon]|nr:response regulator [Candidatus Woesearchaeota archaeon]
MEAYPKSKNILVCEDEVGIIETIKLFCLMSEYSVTSFGDPREFMEHYHRYHNSIDIILLDQNLPVKKGLELIPEIKEYNPDVDIYMMTGFPTETFTSEAFSLGVKDVLVKPFRKKDLLEVFSKYY